MKDHHCKAYLVNTGWNGTGKRISIKETRAIIDAILSGDIEKAPTKHIPILNLTIPTELPGVNSGILDPRDTYSNVEEWSKKHNLWPINMPTTLCNMPQHPKPKH